MWPGGADEVRQTSIGADGFRSHLRLKQGRFGQNMPVSTLKLKPNRNRH